jgi:copper(I)-binding protein
MSIPTRILFGVLFAAALPAVAAAAIVIEQPEIRASLGGQPTTAAYMSIRNTGPSADRLLGASCACAASVMAHATTTVNGVSHMAMEDSVAIPAGGSVAFTPHGRHLMLMGVKAPIASGAKVPITLRFEKAGAITTAFVAGAMPGMNMAGRQHH